MFIYLIVIPARGGSKGIPDKNIIEIGGKPLIAYSIQAANETLSAGITGMAIVSTDSERIAEITRNWNGHAPFKRPDEISGDTAKSACLLLHALDFYEKQGKAFDATILLQPTSPLRTAQDILYAVEIYEKAGQPALISAYQEDYVCDLVSYNKNGEIAIPLSPLHNIGVTRQQHEKLYIRNGAVYITDAAFLRQEKKVISDTPALYVMPKIRSVNLDTVEDLELLKWHLG